MIRILPILAMLVGMLSGCTIHQSIGDNLGSAGSEPKGQRFTEVGPRWNHENTALMYVYRPATKWSMDEFEAPSFNVNSKRIFNIKGGSYTWYEMQPGSYDIVMRRGIMGFEGVNTLVIKTIAELGLEVEAGKVYYLRYSEIDPPETTPQQRDSLVGDGPLQLVDKDLALAELSSTKMLHHSRGLLKPLKTEEDKDLERVFEGNLDGSGNSAPSTKSKTKEEDWWPF